MDVVIIRQCANLAPRASRRAGSGLVIFSIGVGGILTTEPAEPVDPGGRRSCSWREEIDTGRIR
jgi:hypothetical protein